MEEAASLIGPERLAAVRARANERELRLRVYHSHEELEKDEEAFYDALTPDQRLVILLELNRRVFGTRSLS